MTEMYFKISVPADTLQKARIPHCSFSNMKSRFAIICKKTLVIKLGEIVSWNFIPFYIPVVTDSECSV